MWLELNNVYRNLSVWDCGFSVRTRNVLLRNKINNVYELIVQYNEDDGITNLRGAGTFVEEEIEEFFSAKLNSHLFDISVEDSFSNDNADEYEGDKDTKKAIIRDFDLTAISDLRENFYFSTNLLCEWFGISRQWVYQKLESAKSRDKWSGKPLTNKDMEGLNCLISQKSFFEKIEEEKYYLFNNKKDNCVFICVSDEEIKCFYLQDLPETLQDRIRKGNFDIYDRDEMKYAPMGAVVYILKEPYFKPNDTYRYRILAQRRGMTLDEYAIFLSGVPYYGGKSIADDQIISFFKDNLVNGKVHISSDPGNQWIRSYAYRNGYTMKAFVEFFGYEMDVVGSLDTSAMTEIINKSRAPELKKNQLPQGIYIVGQDIPAGIYDFHLVWGHGEIDLYKAKENIPDNLKFAEDLGFQHEYETTDCIHVVCVEGDYLHINGNLIVDIAKSKTIDLDL